jgi:hypothetical protein
MEKRTATRTLNALFRVVDGLFFFASPIAILFFLLGLAVLPENLTAHPNYLKMLDEEGIVARATITHVYEDGDVLFAFTTEDGDSMSQILDPKYYSANVIATLELDTQHSLRYLPTYFEGPILEDHFDQVRAYRKDNSGLWFILGLSWLILIIRPDFLYIGYVEDMNAFFERKLPEMIAKRENR